MSVGYIALIIVLTVSILIVLVSKFKLHAAISLYITSMLLAILVGTPMEKIPKMINDGFGNTCKGIAMVIFLGSLLGIILNKTGAIVKLTDSLVSFFGSKRVLWALGISCFILGVPVFPDTVFLLVIPLCTNLAKKTGISMMAFIAAIQTALITSSLVPPTPGPVAAAAALNLPLGIAIPWGILVSVPGTIATVLYAYYLKNDQIPLNEVYLSDGGDQQENVPNMNFKKAIAPIILPVILIVLQTVSAAFMKGSFFARLMLFIGDPMSALFIGCLYALLTQVKDWVHNMDIRGKWVNSALLDCVGPVFITALGGALASFIKGSGVAGILAHAIVDAHIPGIFVPMAIGFLIRTAAGSNILAIATAAALCGPMLDILGISNLAAYLAICSGSIAIAHANSSGFWLICSLANLNFKQGMRSVGLVSAVSGVFCMAFTLVLYFVGII